MSGRNFDRGTQPRLGLTYRSGAWPPAKRARYELVGKALVGHAPSVRSISLMLSWAATDRRRLASASRASLIRRCSSDERDPLPSSKVQILNRATPERRASLLCEMHRDCRLALSRSAAVVELAVTIVIVAVANVGDQYLGTLVK